MKTDKKYQGFFRIFGIILFIYILSRIDLQQLFVKFKEINLLYYLIALLFLIPGFLIRAFRWKMIVNSTAAEISFLDLAEILAKGILLGVATPGKLGEFWQAKYLAESTGTSGGKAFYTTFIDRMVDLLVTGAVALLGILVISSRFGIRKDLELYILIIVSFVFFVYFFLRKTGVQQIFKNLLNFLIPAPFKVNANSFLSEFYQGFKSLNFNLFLKILGYGFLYYLNMVLIHYFITLSLGIIIPFWYLFLIVAIVLLISIIPITVAGIGLREAGFIYFFSILGLPASSAVALSLLVLFCNILMTFPGVIIFLKRR